MDVLGQRVSAGGLASLMREALKTLLICAARSDRTFTYAEVAKALDLKPPHTIHRAALLIEDLMREQAAKGEPQLASFVISRARGGLPAPGFFQLMRRLELYSGPDTGAKALAMIEQERTRCRCQF